VTFEEYIHYAQIDREREKALPDVRHPASSLKSTLFGKKTALVEEQPSPPTDEKDEKGQVARGPVVTDDEWYHASRALRTATWGSIFYLITTDVLGPYTVPYVFQSLAKSVGLTIV
jgi:hypothetical protein